MFFFFFNFWVLGPFWLQSRAEGWFKQELASDYWIILILKSADGYQICSKMLNCFNCNIATLQYYNIASLQQCNITILQHCNFVTLYLCNFATLQNWKFATLQHCNIATLQLWYFATLQLCNITTLQLCNTLCSITPISQSSLLSEWMSSLFPRPKYIAVILIQSPDLHVYCSY